MAELAAAGHTLLGYDTVMPVFSVIQEAAALGAEVDWGYPEMMPGVKTSPWAATDDLRLPEGWMDAPSIQVVLESLRLLRKELGHKVVIVGKVMGPWSLSYHMVGVEEFLIGTILNPEKTRRSIDVLKQVTIDFAKAQMQAGADVICLADHATGGMVSPGMYRDLLLPAHREILAAIECPTVLHCCGNTRDRIKYFAQAGFDSYHFESAVPVETALAESHGKMTLIGNINNPDVLLTGPAERVADECRRAVRGGVHILAPECAVPLTTPLGNLRTLVEVAEEKQFQI
jgi:MtaA/CmuA family methyltransferase